MSEAQEVAPVEGGGKQEQQTFTQADVDRIVQQRIERERAKYADYDVLKTKAEGAKSVQDQLEEVRRENQRIARDNLAARIAAKHGIAPEDADLFLTGSDEDTLTAQAKRLTARESDRRKQGNYVPNEGRSPKNPAADDMRQFTRALFHRNQD